MAGGLGTRLAEETEVRTNPMVATGGRLLGGSTPPPPRHRRDLLRVYITGAAGFIGSHVPLILVGEEVLALLRPSTYDASPGMEVCDHLHIHDVASALVCLAAHDRAGECNACSGTPVTLRPGARPQ